VGCRLEKHGNKWSVVLDLGKDKNGKRNRKRLGSYDLKSQAKKKLLEVENQLTKGDFIEDDKKKFGDFLDFWLEKYAKRNTRPTTYYGYESMIRVHIKPSLETLKLVDLKPHHLLEYYDRKQKDGLSAQTVRHHHRLISKVLNDAFGWGLVLKNVAQGIKAPVPDKKEMKYLNSNQVEQFLKFTEETTMYHPLFFTAVHTGLRKSELIGLRWKDVDFDNEMLSIVETVKRVKGMYDISPPKNGKTRKVRMTESLVGFLKEYKQKQDRIKSLLGESFNPSNRVFCNSKGKIIISSELTRHFKRALKKANLPDVRLHDIRHTHATLCLQEGGNILSLSERLGHSTTTFTMDVYGHVTQDMQKQLVEKFDKLFNPSKDKDTNDISQSS
jgi:integrase